MRSNEEVVEILRRSGVFEKGHFLLSSGLHSGVKVDVEALDEGTLDYLSVLLAECFIGRGVEVVIGPAQGGNVVSAKVASALSRLEGGEVRSAKTKKTEGNGFFIPRHYSLSGRRLAVVDDVVTTAFSLVTLANSLEKIGATIVGFGAFVNRGGAKLNGLSYFLCQIGLGTWEESECILCKNGKVPS